MFSNKSYPLAEAKNVLWDQEYRPAGPTIWNSNNDPDAIAFIVVDNNRDYRILYTSQKWLELILQ